MDAMRDEREGVLESSTFEFERTIALSWAFYKTVQDEGKALLAKWKIYKAVIALMKEYKNYIWEFC